MNEAPRYVSLRDYLRVVRDQRILIALIALLFAGAALAWSLQQPTVYEAEASLLFKDENVDLSQFGTFTAVQSPEQRAAISAEQIGRAEIVERARKQLGTRTPVSELQAAVGARPEARTNLVVVNVRWGDAKFAARLADAIAAAARDVATRDLRRRYRDVAREQRRVLKAVGNKPSDAFTRSMVKERIGRLDGLARFLRPVEIARTAQVPADPVEPRPIRNALLGLLLGLTAGLLVAFGRDALDRRFRGAGELHDALGLPLLGFVREHALGRAAIPSDGRPALAPDELEAFRILRTNVEFLDVDNPAKVLLVTSALPEEGKSTVAGALAATSAQAGRLTLLVECDLRRPTLAERLGIQATPGLTDYLIGRASPPEILQSVAVAPVTPVNGSGPADGAHAAPIVCIAAGSRMPQPAELLGSERFKGFLRQVATVYDTVIVDTSPLLSVVDTRELLPLADAVVLCVRASRTTREQAGAARNALEHLPKKPTGVVVTGLRSGEDGDYGYYSYSYAYGAER